MYKFDRNETRFPGIILLPVREHPYNAIMKFYVVDIEPP